MTKTLTLAATAFLVFAFQAVTVTNALGFTPKWLFESELLFEAKPASVHSAMRLVHEGGITGKYKIECTMLLTGTVGPLAEDSSTGVEGLGGNEKGILACKAVEGICETPVLTVPIKLPWKTMLSFEEGGGGLVWDTLSSGGTGEPEWEMLCSRKGGESRRVFCGAKYRQRFIENSVSGAAFVWEGRTSGESTCTDGGKAFLEQPAGTRNVVLGITGS
jgi:hypothetical protein